MYIINENDFNRDCLVADNKGISSDGQPSMLTQLIDGRSRLYFKNLLGYELFKDLDQYIIDGELDAAAPTKWLNLINGIDYNLNGVRLKWEGIRYEEGAFNQSILRYFVYDGWIKETLSASTNFGQVVPVAKNATTVRSGQKLASNWNKFVLMNQYECSTPYASTSYVNGIEFIDWFGNSTNDYVSAIKFIKDNAEDYPNAKCTLYTVKNQFGL